MKKPLIYLIATIVIAVLAIFTYNNVFASKPAPQVALQTLDGRSFNTHDLKGKVVMYKFWATDCVTCIKQMPNTVAYYEKYKDQGYETIAVAMKHDKVDAIQRLVDERGYPFTIVYDHDGAIAKAFNDVRFTPIVFLVDRQGNIVKSYIGDYDSDLYIQDLEKVLQQS